MKLNLPIRTVQLAAAAFLVLLGLTVIVRWIFQLGAIDALLPEAARMGLNTPMMLLACGVALSLTGVPVRAAPWRGRVRNACLAAAGLLAALLLLETLTGVAFGIDFVRTPIAPSALTPHPGRPAPNTCLCVLLAVGSLLIANRPRLTPRLDLVRQVLAALLCAIAFSALIGHMLNLSALYRVATFNTMLATSATALCVLGAALFAIPLERPWLRGAVHTSIGNLSRKVNSSISTVLLLVAAGTGLAGFSTMREGLQQSVRDNMLLTTTTNATALATGLESRLLLPAAMAARSSVEQPLARLAMRRDDAQALAALAAVGKNMLDAGMSEVRFEAADGSPISVAGKSGPAAGATRLPLRTEGANAALVWRDGYFLQVEHRVFDNGKLVGVLRTEQPLRAFERMISDIHKSSPSADVLICGRERDDAVCAPSRLYAQSKRIPMYLPDGRINLPINRALINETGTSRTPDLRGVPVLAGYAPIPGFGLGMVVKIDESAVFAPLRKRLIEFAGVVLLIIALGAVALRFQVRPLLTRLLGEQTRNRLILDNSHDAFIALDVDGNVTDWNSQAERMFGWTQQEVLGRPLAELVIPPNQRRAHNEALARFAVSGQGRVANRQVELTAMRRDGSEFPVELSITGYHEGEGYASNAFVRDISARKASERQLVEKERFLRTVTDNIPALIAYVDRDQRYLFANASYHAILGIDHAAMLGKTIAEALGPDTYALLAPQIALVLGGEAVHYEQERPARGGISHFMTDYIPDFGDDGQVAGFYIMVMDITARKKAEIRQAESERRAEAASQAKTEFVANMSHEIRTPMNAVLGIAQLLAATPMAADQRKYLEMIRQSGVSLLRILNDVLDFSKIEAGRLELVSEPFKLTAVVDAVATLMSVSGGAKPIELAIGIDPMLPREFIGDALRLEQVLTNIVGNALKFTAHGEVSLLVEQIAREGKLVQLRFVVRDSGIGISPAQLQRLFAPFSQGDSSMTRRFGGTGLGLTISRRLVDLMGGDIEVDSIEQHGSRFAVRLPLLAIHEDVPQAAPVGLPARMRILVVDDNATSRQFIAQAIARWGWHAADAADGGAALALLAQEGEPYDAVLIDAQLADFDVVREAALRASGAARATAIVQLLNPYERATAGPAASGDAVLLKPVTSSTLFDTLHTALADAIGEPMPGLRGAPGQHYQFDGVNILLVEDNPFNQLVASGILEHTGANVTVCADGLQAVERLRAEPRGFALVLMDVQMPVMDGFAATRAIRRELQLSLPILAMTAGVMEDERERCIECGMNGFISKPVDVDQMLGLIKRHLARPAADAQAARPDEALGSVAAVFDIDKLLMVSAHSPAQRDNLLRLIANMTRSAPLELAGARAAWDEGRAEDAAGTLHSLRGAVGAMGAQRFVEACLAAEHALRERDDGAAALIERARAELAATVEAARAVLAKLGVTN